MITGKSQYKYYVYSPIDHEIDGPFALKNALDRQKRTEWPSIILMTVVDEQGNEVK